jgi:hypothetical protein
VDHYLPKAEYSFLAVHPVNLVPICGDCNSIFKGTREPVDRDEEAPLVNMFIPYHRSALEFAIVIADRSGAGSLQFRITEDDGLRSRRIDYLNKTFRLEERWPSRESEIKNSIVGELQTARRILERFEESPKSVQMEIEVAEMLDSRIKRIGRVSDYVLHASYLRFAANNQDEFEELLGQFLGDGE